MPQTPYDPVAGILTRLPSDKNARAAAWDAFHEATDEHDLATRLRTLALDDSVKADLWDLKSTGTDRRRPVSAEDFTGRPAQTSGTGGYFGVPDVVGDLAMGAVKGLGNTAVTLGSLLNPIITQDDKNTIREYLKPEGTAQQVGYGLEQAGEFLVPGGAAEKGAATITAKLAPRFQNAPRLVRVLPRMGTEAASAASVAAAQGGDPLSAGVVGAAVPGVAGAVGMVAPKLSQAANKQVQQFLGATGQRYKAMGERITPEILKRGIRGSRESVLEQAGQAVDEAGQGIDAALQQFGARKVNADSVHDALESAKDAFRTTREMTLNDAVREGLATTQNGRLVLPTGAKMNAGGLVEMPIVIEPRSIRQLTGLQKIVQQLGPDPSVDQLVAVRRAWDNVVSQAGGFQHRAPGGIGLPLKDTSEAWAKREGANSLRRLLDQEVPELSALNKEYNFWKNLDDVLTQTTQRTGPQGPGLTRELAGVASTAAGAASGDVKAALALGKIGKFANQIFTSPRWRLASAQVKDKLASAIMRGSTGEVMTILSRLAAGGASHGAAAPKTP